MKSSTPEAMRLSVPLLQRLDRGRLAGVEHGLEDRQIVLGKVEDHLDRIDLGDRDKAGAARAAGGVVRAAANQIADRNLHGAEAPVDRRGDFREIELQLIGVDGRLIGLDRRLRRLLRGQCRIIGLLGAGALVDEVLRAAEIGRGADQQRIVLGKHGLVAGKCREHDAIVERDQEIAGLHHLAVPDVDARHLARDARADHDDRRRLNRAEGPHDERKRRLLRGCDGDRDRPGGAAARPARLAGRAGVLGVGVHRDESGEAADLLPRGPGRRRKQQRRARDTGHRDKRNGKAGAQHRKTPAMGAKRSGPSHPVRIRPSASLWSLGNKALAGA